MYICRAYLIYIVGVVASTVKGCAGIKINKFSIYRKRCYNRDGVKKHL